MGFDGDDGTDRLPVAGAPLGNDSSGDIPFLDGNSWLQVRHLPRSCLYLCALPLTVHWALRRMSPLRRRRDLALALPPPMSRRCQRCRQREVKLTALNFGYTDRILERDRVLSALNRLSDGEGA